MRWGLILAALLVPSAASAATVRSDRPRLLLSNGTGFGTPAATFKQRCTSDPAYMTRCQGALNATGGSWPAINGAAAYVVNGDAMGCTNAYNTLQTVAGDTPGQPDPHSFISNNGRTMDQLAVVRDWCDPVLTPAQVTWIEGRITAFADWYVANSPPDVFHDDMPNVWNAVALAGLALSGTSQDAKAQSYLSAADTQWKTVILPAMAYVGDWWHEGFTYVQPSLGSLVWYATGWSTATDEDIFAFAANPANNLRDLFDGYIDFHAYAMRPDYKYFYFGDTTDNKQSIELFSRYLVDMLTAGTGSTLGQALSDEIKQSSRPGYDYSGADAFLMAIFYDASKDGGATPRSTLPTARWMSQGANDVAILRSGWGPNDTVVMITCGDYLGPHQHDESGSFQIYAGAEMTGSTGYYDNFDSPHWDNYYSQHSVHANTLAVVDPSEIFPNALYLTNMRNVNDGGERPLRRDKNGGGYPSPTLAAYIQNKTSGTYYETGDLKTFEQTSCHAYVACDVTAAYDSTVVTTNGNAAKVSEVTRQFVFFPPDHFIVFDRVESTNASFAKRMLVHAIGSVATTGSNGFTLTNGAGTLYGTTLLPAQAAMSTVANFTVAGASWPPMGATGSEQGGTRLEVAPAQMQTRDYFLTLFDRQANSGAAVMEANNEATLTLSDATSQYTLTLNETGALGGHVKVVQGGNVVCDEDLGAMAQPGPDGGLPGCPGCDGGGVDGGGTRDGGSGGDGGPGGNGASPGSSGGCGCGVVGARTESAALVVLGALALLGLRRRR